MYGRDEAAERLVLEAMAAIDGNLARWRAESDGLRDRGESIPTGVRGAYGKILPDNALRGATASIYAEIAHRSGWPASSPSTSSEAPTTPPFARAASDRRSRTTAPRSTSPASARDWDTSTW
jgi:hypothetical protein